MNEEDTSDDLNTTDLPKDSDGLFVFDETRIKKRRDGPSFKVIIKNLYNKYIKSNEE